MRVPGIICSFGNCLLTSGHILLPLTLTFRLLWQNFVPQRSSPLYHFSIFFLSHSLFFFLSHFSIFFLSHFSRKTIWRLSNSSLWLSSKQPTLFRKIYLPYVSYIAQATFLCAVFNLLSYRYFHGTEWPPTFGCCRLVRWFTHVTLLHCCAVIT